MNNPDRGPQQGEPPQGDRYATTSQDTGTDAGRGYAGSARRDAPSILGGRQWTQDDEATQYADRDIQGAHSAAGRHAQHNQGREGSYPQAAAREDPAYRHDDGGFVASQYAQYRSDRGFGASQGERAQPRTGRGETREPGSRDFEDQPLSSYDNRRGRSHDGPRGPRLQSGIGARGGEYAPGYGSSGGYSQEGYGGPQAWRGRGSSDQWRAGDVTGQGYGEGAGRYRGLGPRNYMRSDERIREDLNERLTDSDEIDASGISVEVNNGVATLTGSVGQRWMKHRAEDLAAACSGVRDVNNQIRVQASQLDTRATATTGAGMTKGSGASPAATSPGGGASNLGPSAGGGATPSTAAHPAGHDVSGSGAGNASRASSSSSSTSRPTGSSGSTPA